MHTLSAGMKTALGADVALSLCVQIKRADGAPVIGLTTADRDIALDIGDGNGAVTYLRRSLIEAGVPESSASGDVNTSDITFYFDNAVITATDLRRRLYDGSEVFEFLIDRDNLANGIVPGDRYTMGPVKIDDDTFSFELDGLDAALKRKMGEVISPLCLTQFGDQPDHTGKSRCKWPLNPSVWAATTLYTQWGPFDASLGAIVKPSADNGFWYVADVGGTSAGTEPVWPVVKDATIADNDITWRAVHARKRTGTVNGTPANRYQFLATGIGAQTDFFGFGSLTWLTGANQARQVRVESDDGSGSIEIMDEMLFDIADGDTFEITAGCRKRIVEDCRDKHENSYNARLHPHVPKQDVQADTT